MSNKNDIEVKPSINHHSLKFFGFTEVALGFLLAILAIYMFIRVPVLAEENMFLSIVIAISGLLLLLRGILFCHHGIIKTISSAVSYDSPNCRYRGISLLDEVRKCFFFRPVMGRKSFPMPYFNLLLNCEVAVKRTILDFIIFLIFVFLGNKGLLPLRTDIFLSLVAMSLSIDLCLYWNKASKIKCEDVHPKYKNGFKSLFLAYSILLELCLYFIVPLDRVNYDMGVHQDRKSVV